jgi:hypothetical protein
MFALRQKMSELLADTSGNVAIIFTIALLPVIA